MELRHLRYAVAIADAGSFTRAAARLGLAQPALSQQIAVLEAELGMRLFLRGRTGAQTTPAGAELVERARGVLRDAGDIPEATRRAASGQTGRVRVGYLAAVLGDRLVRAVRRLRASRPGVEVELSDRSEAEQVRGLAARSLDLAVLLFPPARPRRHGLVVAAAHEATIRLGVLVPHDHGLATRASRRVRLEELAGDPPAIIASRASPDAFVFLRGLYMRAGLSVDRLREADGADGLVDLVAAGLAVALVPEALGARGREHTAYLRLRPAATLKAHLAWREGESNPLVAALVRELGGRTPT